MDLSIEACDAAFAAWTMAQLDYYRDGINAVDLGIIGEAQYAVDFVGKATAASLWRRPASHAGTYGGWRWESMSNHPHQFPGVPLMAELAARVDAAIKARREAVAGFVPSK